MTKPHGDKFRLVSGQSIAIGKVELSKCGIELQFHVTSNIKL